MTYRMKTSPYPHQKDIHDRTCNDHGHALFLEMGLGKSKIALDTAGHLFCEGKINAVLVLAPNAVAPNWAADEIPIHLGVPANVLLWETKKATQKGYREKVDRWLATPEDELAILVMSYDAIMTQRKDAKQPMKGLEAAQHILKKRECLFVIDESARIKTPGSKRTIRILAASKHAKYRRAMTGTPVSNSPLDVFTQLKFIDDAVWDPIGCRRFESFSTYFAEWDEFQREDTGQRFKKLVAYRHLDQLHEIVASMGSRLMKDEVLDLPPKIYLKRFFELTAEQKKLYNTLRREYMILLDNGEMVSAALAITRMLRFQQITSGYLPIDDDFTDDPEMIEISPNPRIRVLRETVGDVQGQMIIWGKFKKDLDQIGAMLDEEEITYCTYDGRTSSEDREEARRGFKSGKYRVFLANPSCAGEGLTLTEAKTVIYYNNSFKLADRLQSEDRAHRIGQDSAVTYIDIIAENTIDQHIVMALRQKLDYAQVVCGDSARAWI